jgi:16S rRNA (guanine527-N7)-methyltransferase
LAARDVMKRTDKEISFDRNGSPGPEKLRALFDKCGIHLSAFQVQQLWTYHGLLRQSNPELNLTRVHNFDNMVIKLYVDSILPADLVQLPSPLLDLGTGPGMPGIPLKIYQSHLEILLAESRRKRANFLTMVVDRLSMKGVRIIDKKIGADFQEPVAGVITRAVETMAKTLERVRGCLAPGGMVFFMKGPNCEAELEEARRRWLSVYKLVMDRSYIIPHTRHHRRLVVMERLDQPHYTRQKRAAARYTVKKIESDKNVLFKELKKLLSGRGIKKSGQALVAGAKPIAEALKNFPALCDAWISSEDQEPPPLNATDQLSWYQLAPRLFETLDVFGTHTPLLLIRVPPIDSWQPIDGFGSGCNLLVPFQDPENVGAVIRSAAAFGARQVILLAECAHPFHPRSLRASGGTVMSIRLRQGPFLKELPADLPIIALSAEGTDIRNTVFPPSFGLLIGIEGPGLPALWRRTARRIPIHAAVESLNAATAAAIALYEWSRQSNEGFRQACPPVDLFRGKNDHH